MARAPLTFTWLLLSSAALLVSQVVAQQCYYPNGDKAPEKPCSSAEGSACCPDKWQCLDNGLCHYPPDNLYGRYSCTDQKWNSPGCASNLCTYNMEAYGAESLAQCKDHNNDWCCDADSTNVDCCKESPEPRPFFALQDGVAYATIGSNTADEAPVLSTITGEALSTSGGSQPSRTPDPSSEPPKSSDKPSSKPTPTGPTTPVTSVATSVSSGSAGVETIVITSVIQPPDPTAAISSTNNDDSGSSKIPVIVGCAVGIPLALALVGILFWLFRKRRHQQKENPYDDPYEHGSALGGSDFAGGAKLTKSNGPKATTYRHSGGDGVPELQSQSVGPDRPISVIQGKAELASGTGFQAGAAPPHAPHLVGVGGGTGTEHQGRTSMNSWETAPPGYSPAMNQAAWTPGHHPSNSVELDATSAPPARVQQSPTGPQQYIPYRPPPGHERTSMGGGATGRLADVPEMAEMSAVKTPPA